MTYMTLKVIITGLLVLVISELSKRFTFFGALLASLPITSVLAMLWLYIETKDVVRVTYLATSIFWLVIPSLIFFISVPFFLKKGLHFYLSMGLSMSMTAGCYFIIIKLLALYSIKL